MTLGINTQINDGGNFLPQIRYNIDGGRLFQIDRTPDAAGNWQTAVTELKEGFTSVWDFGSIEVGWMLFMAGMAPSWSMKPLHAQPPAEKPSEEHKHGFRLKLWNPNISIREFGSSSKTLVDAVDEVHTTFERSDEARRGLIPKVRYLGATYIPAKGGQSKARYRPNFEITGWVERAAEFGERTVAVPAPRAAQAASVASNFPQPQQQAVNTASQLAQNQLGQSSLNPRHVGPPVRVPLPMSGAPDDEWGGAAVATAVASATAARTMRDDLNDEIPF